jgi:hypothetical protein
MSAFLLSFNRPSTAVAEPSEPATDVNPTQDEPQIGVRFKGLLPSSVNPNIEGTFHIEFKIYRSPQGGEPIWREAQEVEVKKGEMDIMLGAQNPIPMEIHEMTFKFLGASVNGNREVYPRYSIVNVVYASANEILMNLVERTGTQYESSDRAMIASKTESPTTWRQALLHARNAGGGLPDYEDWYAALEKLTPEAVRERTGHYEWASPWVYDTASHGRYNRYFRGRFEGCDYMDLSPRNAYHYRIVYPEKKDKEAK